MPAIARPFRSVLYIPASNARAMEKAASLPVDAVIFDLEDAVTAAEKPAARDLLAKSLQSNDYGPRYRIVRVNGLDTDWAMDDLKAVCGLAPDAVLLPKVESRRQIEFVTDKLAMAGANGTMVWAMMETPMGILNAAEIAQSAGIGGFVMGTNDLAKDLGSRSRADRLPMMHSLQTCLLAARANGLVCIDGVYNAFKDDEGLETECAQGRDLGMDGKTLIHPAQVAVTNRVFAPSREEVTLARRQIEAFNQAKAEGSGVAVVDGSIVENLHVATAEATLAKARVIAELEES